MAEIQAILIAVAFTNTIKYKNDQEAELCVLGHFLLIIFFNTIIFLMALIACKIPCVRGMTCKKPITKRYFKLVRTMRTNIASMMVIIYSNIPS